MEVLNSSPQNTKLIKLYLLTFLAEIKNPLILAIVNS